MAPRDNEPELPKASTALVTPFSIAAMSMTSFKPTKHVRNVATRRAVLPPTSSQKQLTVQKPVPQASEDSSPRVTIPISHAGRSDIAIETTDAESSDNSSPEVSSQTAAPRSTVPLVSAKSFKRARTKTSHIHEYISTRGDHYVCNRCSRCYKSSGGTGAISRHLKKAHFIDHTPSRIVENRIREGTAADAAILRGAEINHKAEENRGEELMGIGLNKTVLEYLFHQWITTNNISLEQVRNPAFRAFLEYVNPVAHRMLQESFLG